MSGSAGIVLRVHQNAWRQLAAHVTRLSILPHSEKLEEGDLKETLDLILDRHFGNEEPEDEISLATCGLVDPPFSENEGKLTAFKFGNRKSPGPDGIDKTVVKALANSDIPIFKIYVEEFNTYAKQFDEICQQKILRRLKLYRTNIAELFKTIKETYYQIVRSSAVETSETLFKEYIDVKNRYENFVFQIEEILDVENVSQPVKSEQSVISNVKLPKFNLPVFSGPKLQNNIFNILLKFRTNSVALVADIEKMYRQIRLHPDDIKYQTILWRDRKDLELQEYNLLTVTYGLACAPYLAIRTLHQIAHEVQVSNPRISKIIREDFYVDDLLTGCPTVEDAKGLMQQLIAVLGSGGFVLRKWVSNETSIIEDLPLLLRGKGRPFEKIGIDLAGPIQAKPMLKRSKVIFKFYIGLFVCFTTKAIHLEISSDLTAEAFLAALKRFISRRGRPTEIYSDNATNFKGASNILKERWKLFKAANIQDFSAIESINWHFIPPSAPNFGGLWEAGIKSVETILSKTMKSRLLNYEELLTLLAQIEACLNSRPLTFVSNDPNDLTALTPGHFLIGNAMRHDAESDHSTLNLRSRWSLIQPQRDYFWNRWSCEYLHQLQERRKWRTSHPDVNIGDLVMLKEQNKPLQWKLARIVQIFPGEDDHVRVVLLRSPVEPVTQENIDKIHVLVMLDRRMTVRRIEETLGILKTTVDRIMREHLGLGKLSARWVPKLLTPDQKVVRRKLFSDNLALFEANPVEFVSRFVTMNDTWAHHFTPESKQQSMQWRTSGSLLPKKAKTVPSAKKVMVSVFWDSEGVFLLDFLNKGQTITGNYYANLEKQLREAIKEKRRGMLSRKIVYHQDNAPSLRSLQAMAAIYDSGFELLPHAPYSPHIASSDFHLFPHLKKSISGIHFRSDEEVIVAVNSFLSYL
ncbi:hypothetical protein LAZ67_3002523 [Cordylochernes scorpioides]|uniref:Integrase catalytic domain-containing protein n=1 Tax=Cordylochernes scorpioides TaxID=51811 RepID=A0ABY6K9A9_9ARAC|nr:hypothetical protein LAZ67_3002523 [Cordylochernes scorpioides]